jgi:hypothetical protein
MVALRFRDRSQAPAFSARRVAAPHPSACGPRRPCPPHPSLPAAALQRTRFRLQCTRTNHRRAPAPHAGAALRPPTLSSHSQIAIPTVEPNGERLGQMKSHKKGLGPETKQGRRKQCATSAASGGGGSEQLGRRRRRLGGRLRRRWLLLRRRWPLRLRVRLRLLRRVVRRVQRHRRGRKGVVDARIARRRRRRRLRNRAAPAAGWAAAEPVRRAAASGLACRVAGRGQCRQR